MQGVTLYGNPEAQFLVPDWGMKTAMAAGRRTSPPAYVAWRAVTATGFISENWLERGASRLQDLSSQRQTMGKRVNLKVPKCEIFDPFFFTSVNPIWVGDLRTGEKKKNFRRPRQIFAILFFLRRLSLR
jgi:hypothetical protein